MWVNLLWQITKGDAAQYDALKSKDIFEFFEIINAHKALGERRTNGNS